MSHTHLILLLLEQRRILVNTFSCPPHPMRILPSPALSSSYQFLFTFLALGGATCSGRCWNLNTVTYSTLFISDSGKWGKMQMETQPQSCSLFPQRYRWWRLDGTAAGDWYVSGPTAAPSHLILLNKPNPSRKHLTTDYLEICTDWNQFSWRCLLEVATTKMTASVDELDELQGVALQKQQLLSGRVNRPCVDYTTPPSPQTGNKQRVFFFSHFVFDQICLQRLIKLTSWSYKSCREHKVDVYIKPSNQPSALPVTSWCHKQKSRQAPPPQGPPNLTLQDLLFYSEIR